MINDLCEMTGCDKPANRITSTETKLIMICDECFYNKYKS